MAPWPYFPTSHKFRQPLMLWLRLTRDASHACIIIAKSGANIAQTIADYKKNLDYCRGVVQQFWIFFYLPWSRGPPQIRGPEAMSASSPLILAQWGISRKIMTHFHRLHEEWQCPKWFTNPIAVARIFWSKTANSFHKGLWLEPLHQHFLITTIAS